MNKRNFCIAEIYIKYNHQMTKSKMSNTENLNNKDAIDTLKSLFDAILVCLFCTDLKTKIKQF